MKLTLSRLAARFLAALILLVMLIDLFMGSVQAVHALTTAANDIPGAAVAISDNSCGTPLVRTIAVGASVVIADINVGVNINHARRSDVRVTLTSPAGTTVVLIPGTGLGSPVVASPDDYDNYDVMLDDTSVGSLYDNSNDPVGFPYFDRFARPAELLSAFKGENAAGNWTLRVCDTRAGTTGTYNRSQLVITSADPNTVSGTVFTDYNQNGIRGSSDAGVSGVTVTAYDPTNAVIATTTTDVLGNYTLNIPDGTQVRIEFSTIPANLRPGAFGRDSGTTVQFVASPAAGVDMGLSKPDEYCQNNPFLVMPCYINGDPLGGGTASAATVLYSIPNSAYGRADNTISQPLATGAQIGSTWGLAYQRSTNTVFAGALAKRHAGFGPLGGGGIYSIVVDPLTGAASSVSNFVDIDTFAGVDDGALDDTARGLPAVATTPNTDSAAWDAVGKQAIGDMDIGASDDTLWLINLTDRTLYSLFIGIPAVAPATYSTATPITLPAGATACAASDVRPWAVEVYQGFVYVGVVCSAESTQNVNDLRAYIIRTSEAAPGTFSLVYEFPLNYPRGVVSASGPGYPAEWRPWSNVFTSLWCGTCGGSGLAYGNQIIYPQPILSDIEFDTDGDMILGFIDRAGHQTGEVNYSTSAATTSFTFYDFTAGYAATPVTITAGTTFEGTSAGDMLRVCNVGGVFALENNATCGGVTTDGAGSAPAQGPGGGEYYWQDMYSPSAALNSGTHNEVTLGGLVVFPGTDEVVTSVFDPFAIRSGGLTWFSNATGTRTRAYEIFAQTDDASRFGKAAGIGDVEGFCFSAPIEIGNRIWLDSDGDGIQDAGEAPIAGVTVELYQGGTLIGTAVTDANGGYYFSSGPGTSTASQIYLIDELNPNSNYEIRIPNAQGGSQQAALAGLLLTTPDADADQRDSDASYVGNNAVITVITGDAGDNDHTFDFGFTATYSLGNRVWFDTNNSATLDGAEVGIAGVRVELYQDTGATPGVWDAGDTFLSFDTTDANGYYRFDNLNAGDYVVLIPDDNFRDVGVGDTVPGNPLSGYWSSSTTIAANGTIADATANDPDTTSVDSDDNGRTTLLTTTTIDYVASAAVTLGPGSAEPTTDNDPSTNPEPGESANNRSDRTVDFGFYRTDIGNIVFEDVNGDGDYDVGTDLPLAGATVQLFASDGVTEINVGPDGILGTADDAAGGVTTLAAGTYNFSGLPAGDYIVRVTPPVGFTSTVDTSDPADTADPDTNIDNNDNGIGLGSGLVSSGTLTMTPAEVAANITVNNANGTTSDPTVDFGFVRAYSLGNRVWFDTNNNSTRDVSELGVDGVLVELYAADGSGNPTGPALQTTTTAGGGYYRFDNLTAGDYVVVIPADNFTSNGSNDALVGYWSSGTSRLPNGTLTESPAPDADLVVSDTDDNGTLQAGGVRSAAVTLGPGSTEPTGEADLSGGQGANDDRADMTVDFGFYTMTLGNQVWADINDDGLLNGGEIGINGVTMQLYSGDGTTLLATTTTAVNGNYSFTGLPAGDYIVRIDPAEFNVGGTLEGTTSSTGGAGTPYEPAPDSDVDTTDSDDNGTTNGVLGTGGFIETEVVTLTPGAEAASSNSTGTTDEPRVDFGIVTPQVYSLGNRVWFDTNNNSAQDAGEVGVNGVVVELYAADGSGNPIGAVLATATTAGGGYYRFDNLPAGDYVVVIVADNFTDDGSDDALVGYWSSATTMNGTGVIGETAAPNPDNDLDLDDNGTLQTAGAFNGAVISDAVTLGPLGSEPTNDDDPVPGSQAGEAPDDYSNRTVDFGFYLVEIGDLVFVDVNEDGDYDVGVDTPLAGATVQLFAADGTTEINVGPDGIFGTADDAPGGVTTGGTGLYNFSGLPQGDYIVRVTPPAGYTSTVDTAAPADTTNPDVNTDNNDNGIGLGAGTVSSGTLTMNAGEVAANITVNNATGVTTDPTVDFGFLSTYSLGNRVWFDTDNDSTRDAGTELGVDGVVVQLYAADGAGNPTGAVLQTDTTSGGGYYRFDGLAAGDYVVVIVADNFTANGSNDALVGYWSSATTMDGVGNISETAAPDPDTDLDDDDNGTLQTAGAFSGAVISPAVTIGPLSVEPTGETDLSGGQGSADGRANMTVDFGFYRLQLGNLVFEDVDNDGVFTAGTDTPLAGATVQLFAADGVTEINVGPDGVFGTADDAAGGVVTGAGGTYLFSGLPQGDYIVRVTPPAGYLSTIDSADQTDNDDPDTNTDNNDNGDGVLAGPVNSAVVTLTPGSVGAASNNTVTQATGTTYNPTLDFGFVTTGAGGLTKTLLSSNQAFTTDPNVAIGEIVTYRVTVTIPTGAFTNAQLVDTLERGLSFMDCVAITSGTLTTSNPLGFADICANPTVDDAGGGTPVDVGRRVTFNFGTLTNPGAPQALTIDYRAVVLDSAANVSGTDLDNSVVWSSDSGTLGPRTTTVTVVEPDVSIVKTSSTSNVSIGSVITLALTIQHTAASQTDAYDLVITDVLPATLDFVPGTLNCNAGAQPADVGTCLYNVGTRTISGTWSNFQLSGGNAQITFDVTVLSLPATNVANVAWTSLPGVPPSPPGNPPGQQNSNVFSTERDYDPGSPIDVYGTSSTLTLGAPGGGTNDLRAANIPNTGFAPNVRTDLSSVPLESYNLLAGNIWFEIPSLGVKSSIVGVPYRNGEWNVAWLGKQAGWLEGSAFPTWDGNSVITGHVYLSNGLPGPFVNLSKLKYGDRIIVHANGQKYTYEIRTNKVVSPTDSTVFKHEEYSWLTFITCKEYDEKTNTYRKRVVVRAVLVKVEADK
ncbi:MAG: sortase [Anaerolineales bacterium]|nr:MAG: sortase [Anaerolineales bacterium]